LKQIIQSYKDGNISIEDVPMPACKAGGVLVQNLASLISVGTEKLMIETGQKSLLGKARARPDLVRQAWAKAKKEGFFSVYKEAMNRLDEPIPMGYSAAGIVLEVGPGVKGFNPGDRVAVCGAGYASHAEIIWVPENLCVPVPEGVDMETAAFVTLGAIALHGVREAGLTLGERAAVIGLGLIGLITVQLLKAQGCRVMGVDLDPHKTILAQELGADMALVPGRDDIEEAVANFTAGTGVDAVIITAATDDNRPITLAENIARQRARLVLVGVADLQLTRKNFWEKELTFTVSKASGPGSVNPLYEAKGVDYPVAYVRWTEGRNLHAFLDLVAQGKVKVDRLITHRFAITDGLSAYDLILKNREPYIGVIIQYPVPEAGVERQRVRRVSLQPAVPASGEPAPRAVGFIGGGMFSKNILLPALKRVKDVELVGVATTTGLSSEHLAKKFGFAYAATDQLEILNDPRINNVFIMTRHNLHAAQVVAALKAGKHVFVEKPLCITEEELEEIIQAYDGSRLLVVGFNRRFSPLTQEVKASLARRTTPLVMIYRVNAGFYPDDLWVHDPQEGGGRLLGEVCHYIDFFRYFSSCPALKVSTTSISGEKGKYRPDDNLAITVSFQDGSLGQVIYTSKGSKLFSRERFEVYCEESVGVIEDFRLGQIISGGRKKKLKRFSMNMGYQEEMEFFFNACGNPSHYVELFQSFVDSTRATLRALDSLRMGRPLEV
jgi:predicted dehydrogenase